MSRQIFFNSLSRVIDGSIVRLVEFSRETGSTIYDINVRPDGSESFRVNARPVDALPDLPSTHELRKAVVALKPFALALLVHHEASAEAKTAWWTLKGQVDGYNSGK